LNTNSLKSRLVIWKCTSKLFNENPFFGIGINNWELEFPRHYKDMIAIEKDIGIRIFYQRPHNDYIWAFSETGIFGGTCYLGIFIFGLYSAFKTRNIRALAGLLGYMVIAFFSFPKERAFHSMMLIYYLADSMGEFKTIKVPRFATIGALLVMSLVLAEFSLCYTAERHIRKMAIARDRRQWQRVLAEADKIPCVKTMDPFTLPIKWYTGEAHYFLGNHKQAVLDTAKAFEHNPNNLFVLDRMGSLMEGLGDLKAAESCYRRALDIHPGFEYSNRKLKNLLANK
jgi:tetratricopeptide (TPR) repeat protein